MSPTVVYTQKARRQRGSVAGRGDRTLFIAEGRIDGELVSTGTSYKSAAEALAKSTRGVAAHFAAFK